MKKVVKEKSLVEKPISKLMQCKTCDKEISKTAKQCPHCGEVYSQKKDNKEANKLTKEYANSGSKSRFISLILTALFGNLGLFYAGFKAGIGLLIVNVVLTFVLLSSIESGDPSIGLMLFLAFSWYVLPIFWGDSIVSKQKRKLLAEAKLMSI